MTSYQPRSRTQLTSDQVKRTRAAFALRYVRPILLRLGLEPDFAQEWLEVVIRNLLSNDASQPGPKLWRKIFYGLSCSEGRPGNPDFREHGTLNIWERVHCDVPLATANTNSTTTLLPASLNVVKTCARTLDIPTQHPAPWSRPSSARSSFHFAETRRAMAVGMPSRCLVTFGD